MKLLKILLPLLVLSGCSTYSWKSSVPEDMRTVAVPVFRNESNITGIGGEAARQILREIQREGTFRISGVEDCALEVQGTILGVSRGANYNRRESYMRGLEVMLCLTANVSIIDHRNGKVLIDNRKYIAETPCFSDDIFTSQRDASGRIADILAHQIVDDLLHIDFEKTEVENGK